jgi:hypothetical protein
VNDAASAEGAIRRRLKARRHPSATRGCLGARRERGSYWKGKERKVSMGRLLSVFAAVGILGAATVALAAEATYRTTGKIKSVDLMRHVITLEDGSTYKVAKGVNIKRMKAGEKVTVTISGFGGTIEASAIAPSVD